MAKTCGSPWNRLTEGWNDNQFSEFKSGCCDGAAESGEVILVAVSNLLDESVGTKPLEHTGKLRRRDAFKASTEGACLKSADS